MRLAFETTLHLPGQFGVRQLGIWRLGNDKERTSGSIDDLLIEPLWRLIRCLRKSQHVSAFLQFRFVSGIQNDISRNFLHAPQILRAKIKKCVNEVLHRLLQWLGKLMVYRAVLKIDPNRWRQKMLQFQRSQPCALGLASAGIGQLANWPLDRLGESVSKMPSSLITSVRLG
jgi:hypothetical protein